MMSKQGRDDARSRTRSRPPPLHRVRQEERDWPVPSLARSPSASVPDSLRPPRACLRLDPLPSPSPPLLPGGRTLFFGLQMRMGPHGRRRRIPAAQSGGTSSLTADQRRTRRRTSSSSEEGKGKGYDLGEERGERVSLASPHRTVATVSPERVRAWWPLEAFCSWLAMVDCKWKGKVELALRLLLFHSSSADKLQLRPSRLLGLPSTSSPSENSAESFWQPSLLFSSKGENRSGQRPRERRSQRQ